MDMSNFTPNVLYNDEPYSLPEDLCLDQWRSDAAVKDFVVDVLTSRYTPARVQKARMSLEQRIVEESTSDWLLRLHSLCIRLYQCRTTHAHAAHIFAGALEAAVTAAIQAKSKGISTISEDDIWIASRGEEVREWLREQGEHLKDDYDSFLRPKKSLVASHEDNDMIDDLCSTLETEGPDSPDYNPPGSEMVLDLSNDEAVERFELTTENKTAFRDALRIPAVQLRVCRRWTANIGEYFKLSLSDASEGEVERACLPAVSALMQMKNAPRRTTTCTESWQDAVARSGLAELLTMITRTDFMLRWQLQSQIATHEVLLHALHSSCFHQWRESLAAIYQSWTPKMSPEEIASAAAEESENPGLNLRNLNEYGHSSSEWLRRYVARREQSKRTEFERKRRRDGKTREFVLNARLNIGEQFLGFLGDHPQVLPDRYNMQGYFFLLDRAHFLRNFTQWIRGALLLYGYTVSPSPFILGFCLLNSMMKVSPPDVEKIYTTVRSVITEHLQFDGQNEKLYLLYKECEGLRRTMKKRLPKVKLETLEGFEEVSVHYVTALDEEELEKIRGCAFTFHDTDHIQTTGGKGKGKGKKDSTEHRPGTRFLDPRKAPLNLERVAPIEKNILGKYKRDVHIFIEKSTGTLVGGVIFNALTDAELRESLAHHALMSQHPNLQRGASFLEFAFGKMVPIGFRVPMGGRPGEDYAPYKVLIDAADKSQEHNDNEDVRLMFGHAKDSERLFNAVRRYVPEVVKEIRKVSDEHGLKDMGSCGVSSYYCTNYMAPQHKDGDIGWSICSQLFKNLESAGGSETDDFNFAFAKWGKYIQTQKNCVWWFRSNDLHGTIMPTNSTVQNLSRQAKEERRNAVKFARMQRMQRLSPAERLRGGAGSDREDDEDEDDRSEVSQVAIAGSPPRTGSGGVHVTTRKKDADRARTFKQTEERSAARNRYWRERIDRL
ncbi:unnamed protein product [Peniophora sp. CBMAI 1063]|nr:unnamed protein product [Peniophora sp. CBMAI 1063]